MPDYSNSRKVNESSALNRIIRGTVIIVVSLALAIVYVSFAVHHMRLQFEEEFKSISDRKITDISNVVGMTIHGDEIIADPVNATTKYTSVFNLMLANMSDDDFSDESYALFLYSGGQISPMILSNEEDPNNFVVAKKDISEWLSSDNAVYKADGENYESVLVPISDSSGRCVAVFEYKCTFDKLSKMGDELEHRVLIAVCIVVAAGVILFGVQTVAVKVLSKPRKGETKL